MKRFLAFCILVAISFGATGCSRRDEVRIFGVAMGDPLSSLNSAKLNKDASSFILWYSFEPDEPHIGFAYYYAFVTPKHGVCAVEGGTNGPRHGEPAFENYSFNELLDTLTKKYGTTPVDHAEGDVIYRWDKKENPALTLPPEISDIMLLYSSSDGVISIKYDFSNWNDCWTEVHSSGL